MDVNLDVSHSEYLKLGGPAPDVLVLPSILRQFSKVRYSAARRNRLTRRTSMMQNVEGTAVINPSVFGKSHIMAQLDIRADAGGNNKICDSVKVNLKRLS
jgi:DNA polymerase alpha subunit B